MKQIKNHVFNSLLAFSILGSSYAPNSDIYAQRPVVRRVSEDSFRREIIGTLYEVSISALDNIGKQGGYIKTKPKAYEKIRIKENGKEQEILAPFFYDKGEYLIPELSDLEKEISNYVEEEFLKQINENQLYYKRGSKIETKAKIKKGKVSFEYDIDLRSRSSKANQRLSFSIPDISINSKLFEMHEVAFYITDSHKEYVNSICISELADMSIERDLSVIMNDYNKNTTLIFISPIDDNEDKKTEIYPFHFSFLNRYSEEELNAPSAPPPEVDEIHLPDFK